MINDSVSTSYYMIDSLAKQVAKAEKEGLPKNVVKNKKVFTPSIQNGCLNGITRDAVLSCARKEKIPVQVKSLRKKDLFRIYHQLG